MRMLFVAALALLTGCSQKKDQAQKPATDRDQENLKGNVKIVKSETYVLDSATGKLGALDSKTEEEFDNNGYGKSYTSSDGKDSMVTKSIYHVNDNGYVTDMSTTVNGKPKESLKIDFDENGKYKGASGFDSTGKQDAYYTNLVMNKFGQLISGEQHHLDSTLKMTFSNNYDSIYYVGGITKDSVGNMTNSTKRTLDNNRRLAKEEITSVDKGVPTTTITTVTYDAWDKQGNWTQETIYNDKGRKIKVVKRVIEYNQ